MTLLEQMRQEDLERAYMAFTSSASSLERSYRELGKRAERLGLELHEANDRLRAILAALPAGVVAAAADGRIMTVNLAACAILGLASPPEPGVLLVQDLLDAGGDVLLIPSPGPEERLVASKEGVRRVRLRSLLLAGGGGALWILEDLSELERLEGEVARLDRLAGLGRLALSIAHEIRNPLNAVSGFAGLLLRRLSGEKEQNYATRIVEGVRRVDTIIQNLLAFARPAGKQFTSIDLSEVVRSTLVDWSGGVVSEVIRAESFPVRADAQAMRRILENLLQNAVDAGGQTVPIEVGLTGRAGSIVLWVEDGGPGIGPEERQEIFEPFWSRREQGTGLGLAIVKSLVEAHGGRIRAVEPESLGGARLELVLPAGGER